jgi:hypothetical protein
MSKKKNEKKRQSRISTLLSSYIFKVNFDQNENKFLILKMLFINSELTMELSPCNSKTLELSRNNSNICLRFTKPICHLKELDES